MVSDTIKFIFSNKIYKIKNPDPNKTILSFIRNDLRLTGTKEGCAEGGCGACTIVLGELDKNKIIYKSINACISFLPIIDGKHLIIIENLTSNNKLHPIQEAMVKFHGSQCGFCTPGFVMSLFAMYKNFSKFNDETIDETLSGNLCRCTGYRPIIDAAKSLNYKSDKDHFKKDEKKIINLLKKIRDKEIQISYKDKKYFAPKTLLSLKKILKKNSNMKFLSGGTDLSLEVTKQRGDIKNIVSLNSIKELKFIKKTKNFIEIGSGVSLYEFQNIIKSYYPDFYNILTQVKVRFKFIDKDVILEDWSELIKLDEYKNFKQVRFSPRLDFVPILEKKELDLYYRARKKLSDLYNSEKFRIQFKLEQGDLLMMDNYRLLHGRTEFDINEGNRFLQGCYIDFDSTEGKLRHIKRKFNL